MDNKAWKEVMLIPCRSLQERSFGETVIMWENNVHWQEDFIDTSHFSKQNGSKHIFTVINVLYKHAWMVSLTGKHTSVVGHIPD